ncbi:DUF1345 domain-containing protein [Chitinophaga sancti]|uniref:DUF1345 domain-containing protein n=1 Tax=Chitinophaga sancti TaxID=1004 RepID=UPI002A755C88|nr:DUF1345 domain-containing protein [Chitinophaga sancti]WPQ63451.1 DUF1345 domain-containing protein [Chitinophaga sancti]
MAKAKTDAGLPSRSPLSRFFINLHPLKRVLIALLSCTIVWLFIKNGDITTLLKTMILWDVFSFVFCIECLYIFFNRTTKEIREYARQEDGSRLMVFILIILACFASMLMVLLLMLSSESREAGLAIYLPVAVAGILLSWAMVHCMFAIHYAHIYYDDAEDDNTRHVGGLEFPEEKNPDYLDFAYFSFVIGMTFQVSDVEISNKKLRRIALLHGLLAFGLNTFVVALTINLVGGLRN